MIPGSAIDVLFALLSPEGFDDGDEHVRAASQGTVAYKLEGDVLFLTLAPAIQATKDGKLAAIFRRFTRGAIRTVKIERSQATAYVETDVIGTIEKRIEVSR